MRTANKLSSDMVMSAEIRDTEVLAAHYREDEGRGSLLDRFVNRTIASGVVCLVLLSCLSVVVPEDAAARDTDVEISTAVIWTSFIAGAALIIRGSFPQNPYDMPTCKAGFYNTVLPMAFLLLVHNGLIVPTYFAQGIILALGANAQIMLMVALGGRHGKLRLAVKYSFLSLSLVAIPVAFAPGAITGTEPKLHIVRDMGSTLLFAKHAQSDHELPVTPRALALSGQRIGAGADAAHERNGSSSLPTLPGHGTVN